MAEITWKLPDVKITFSDTFPNELKERISAYLENARWMFPRWCQEILVNWDAHNTNGCVRTNLYYEYRYFTVTFSPLFLGQGEDVEQEQIYHEIIHGLTSYVSDFAREIIETFCEQDDTAKILRQELTRRNEAITQDFAYAIANKFKEGK